MADTRVMVRMHGIDGTVQAFLIFACTTIQTNQYDCLVSRHPRSCGPSRPRAGGRRRRDGHPPADGEAATEAQGIVVVARDAGRRLARDRTHPCHAADPRQHRPSVRRGRRQPRAAQFRRTPKRHPGVPIGQPRAPAADSVPGRVSVPVPAAYQQPTGPGVGTCGADAQPAWEHVPAGQRVVERRVWRAVVVRGGDETRGERPTGGTIQSDFFLQKKMIIDLSSSTYSHTHIRVSCPSKPPCLRNRMTK